MLQNNHLSCIAQSHDIENSKVVISEFGLSMLMVILLNSYMFNEVMRYLHDIRWFYKMQFRTHCFVYKQSKTGFFNYNVLHCIDFDDVNLTISPFDRPITAEFTKGFSIMTSLINIICL